MSSSRNDDVPLAKVVDLRRWREERDRRSRAAAEEPELTSTRAPDRIAWPFRALALIARFGFAACGGVLGWLPVLRPRQRPLRGGGAAGEPPSPAAEL